MDVGDGGDACDGGQATLFVVTVSSGAGLTTYMGSDEVSSISLRGYTRRRRFNR